jgi:hypothetical protein
MTAREWIQLQRARLKESGVGADALELLLNRDGGAEIIALPPPPRPDYTPAIIAGVAIVLAAIISRR